MPTDFDSRLKVFEIVDSHGVPGYVYLRLKYVLSKRKTDSEYVIKEYISRPNSVLSHNVYVTADVRKRTEIHGPSARITHLPYLNVTQPVDIDTVSCVRCLMWPTQARDWPTRHRNCGWPDSETVVRVVNNGCDVVGVAHSLCKDDEWMKKHQWRLPSSRAEVVLLNSWTSTQQIIYHMLRTFMKAERVINCPKNSVTGKNPLSNYHVKTMMLWACEMKPLHWWTDRSNLIDLFVHCLYLLDEWISEKCGQQHYFIKNAYLNNIDILSLDTVTALIKSVREDCLTEWFIDNYMRKCAELCPANVPILCSDMVTKDIIHDAANAILKCKMPVFAKTLVNRYFVLP